MTRTLPAVMLLPLAWMAPVVAHAADDEEEVIEIIETTKSHEHHYRHWAGVHFGTILTPHKIRPGTRPMNRVTADQARACLNPVAARFCGNVRGFDMRLNFFHAGGTWRYPRFQGFFRSGWTTGRFDFEPDSLEAGYQRGEARSMAYVTVPLFVGGNVYLFKRSPVRPYGGLGFGLDILKMKYRRHDRESKIDTSARVGFELHAGIEARISNYVAVTGEVMQLWSARRRLGNLPDFSNQGLTFIVGVSFNFPTWGHHRHKHVHRVRTVKKVQKIQSKPSEPAAEVVAEPPPPPPPPLEPPEVAEPVPEEPTAPEPAPAPAPPPPT